MPQPSAFKQEAAEKVLQALRVGASYRTAAAAAGVSDASLRRWIAKGKESAAGTRFREFYDAVQEAEAAPRLRALGIVYKELPDNPALAWKFLERLEPGFGPTMSVKPEKSEEPEQQRSVIDELASRRTNRA